MKRIIFRVDDRLIHGQVIEGWIKNFHIPKVILVSDKVASDPMQQMIYKSSVPHTVDVIFYTNEDLANDWFNILQDTSDRVLVLYESVTSLFESRELISQDLYLNIGCVASRPHTIQISDTVFLEEDELDMLRELSNEWKLYIQKLPWEKNTDLCSLE